MTRRYFGTDGVRGPYGGPVVNEAFAARLAQAAGQWAGGSGVALIGWDTRASGPVLAAAVAAGLQAAGLQPRMMGVVPTPAVARAVSAGDAVLGVVLTASHNPASDNGIKFFNTRGIKLTDDDEGRIEALLPPDAAKITTEVEIPGKAGEAYRDALAALLPAHSLAGWRIVVDTANGATCGTTPAVLRALGAEVIGLGDAPDGRNINEGVGSEHPEAMAARVLAGGARLGIAHDGDGDRCILCDERGSLLDGDEILTILALHALAHHRLPQSELVVTQQSNLGVDAAITAAGGRVVRTDIGDRYVIERMLADGAALGGESSGHIICTDVAPTGDGLGAALKILEVMLATGRPLSELRTVLRKFPQRSRALRVREKKPFDQLPGLTGTLASVKADLGSSGRLLVRYSGTESKLRLLVEGPTDQEVDSALARIESAARAELEMC